MSERIHISICVCTFRRIELLARLLKSLSQQETDGLFTFSVVVTDNDCVQSAEAVVSEMRASLAMPICYCVEPRKNIALARNKAVANARGDFVAFIDDDEFPDRDWLLNLFKTCNEFHVAGVLGPVRPHFDEEAPVWVRKGGFYDRAEHNTGFVLSWPECRTGNVLLTRELIGQMTPVFRTEFGTGGEDQDFFRRAVEKGNVFIWCNDAVVHEVVPPQRWKRGFLIKRALLRGSNSLRHSGGRGRNILKAVIAVPLYLLVLPFLFLAGQHLFMKYLVRLCDHAGRLLAILGLNPVRERAM